MTSDLAIFCQQIVDLSHTCKQCGVSVFIKLSKYRCSLKIYTCMQLNCFIIDRIKCKENSTETVQAIFKDS